MPASAIGTRSADTPRVRRGAQQELRRAHQIPRGYDVLALHVRRSPPPLVIRGLVEWPGLPSLFLTTPELYNELRLRYEQDPEVFERYPVAVRPPLVSVDVLRLRRAR